MARWNQNSSKTKKLTIKRDYEITKEYQKNLLIDFFLLEVYNKTKQIIR